MNIVRLEDRLIVVSTPIGVPVYDFDFDRHFTCDHPYSFREGEPCVLRLGAVDDYTAVYAEKCDWGLMPVNTPQDHVRASELEHWYPLIADLTPRTEVFEHLPPADLVEARFGWPVFLKGSRQTAKHSAALSVIESVAQYEVAAKHYRVDKVLHWQKPVLREFVPLLPVPGGVPGKVRPSLEYRSFWWHGTCVGWGRYWYEVPTYHADDAARGLALAGEVARRLNIPFLVVDFAKTAAGGWIVIECNDAQESGYAGIAPQALWRRVLDTLNSP
jgi:hypothetical protein